MNHTRQLKIISVTLLCLTILTVIVNNPPEFNSKSTMINDDKSPILKTRNTMTAMLSSPYNTTFLPGTNLTIREYENAYPRNSYNVSVISIDKINWYVHCDYFLNETQGVFSFDSSVNRTSVECLYGAINYYDPWFQPSPYFDNWINTSNFYIGYVLESNEGGLTVEGTETISMQNLGNFEVWRLTGVFASIFSLTARYDVTTGMLICTQMQVIEDIWWYNLTRADFGQIPPGYDGPTLVSLSPSNNTVHPNGTTIDLEFTSPYGIHTVYYQWDDGINYSVLSRMINTLIPVDNGSHHLDVIAIDSLGYRSLFNFVLNTNTKLPSILVNYKNNSRIQSASNLIISVTNSNGTFFYGWDAGVVNPVDAESATIPIPNSEEDHILNVSAMSGEKPDLWYIKQLVLVVDDTPPKLTIYDPNNGSVIKGTVTVRYDVSERSNLTYILSNGFNDNFIVGTERNHTISFYNLINGSYQLNITAYDEATNPVTATLLFEIYASAFGWNWDLYANIPRTIDVVDASETTWFHLTLLSKTDQNFNLTVLPDESTPSITEKMLYIIQFSCDQPSDIIFMTLNLPLDDTDQTNSFDVYQWVHWDNSNNQWQEITTSYNAISHSWEATYEGDVEFFALLNTGDTTELISVEPGGGQIPAFTTPIVITSLITCSIILRKKKSNQNPYKKRCNRN